MVKLNNKIVYAQGLNMNNPGMNSPDVNSLSAESMHLKKYVVKYNVRKVKLVFFSKSK